MASPIRPAPPMAHPSQFPVLEGKAHPDVVRQISLISRQNRQLQSKLEALQHQHEDLKARVAEQHSPQAIKQAIQQGGQQPLHVQGLLGQLSQGQITNVPRVTALPGLNDPLSQDGVLVQFGGNRYRFDSTTVPPSWVLF